jgi:hypothetical protein
MAEIKSLSAVREKWARVTPMRTEDYKLGVENPKRDWADETEAAKGNWKMGAIGRWVSIKRQLRTCLQRACVRREPENGETTP